MKKGRALERTIEHQLDLIALALRIARTKHAMGELSAATLADIERRAERDRAAIRSMFRGLNRRRGN